MTLECPHCDTNYDGTDLLIRVYSNYGDDSPQWYECPTCERTHSDEDWGIDVEDDTEDKQLQVDQADDADDSFLSLTSLAPATDDDATFHSTIQGYGWELHGNTDDHEIEIEYTSPEDDRTYRATIPMEPIDDG